HRWSPDVDHLDRVLLADAVAPRHFAEGIEVHADEVERLDLLLRERRDVVVAVAPREDRRVDPRVERLHPPAEYLGRAGQVFDPVDVEPDLALEEVRRAAAGDEVPAEVGEPAREALEAGLVVDGDQRAHSSCTTSGSNRCSTSWIRSTSVARGST